ncbi:replication initiation protein [Scandinavium sp. H11S7]|uniref:Replication initiation protein n=1 Tax=Scandinavium hiltneri TaxID=2926519 RepID=A0ABT2E110_9ENTR|nr:replication initiation protein [Scandinavium hiltneri]MCS2161564.1 replication initiation protein [Scandinavium hiltneri]
MQEPPVQPDYHSYSGNYQLESNPEQIRRIASGGSHW